VPKYTIQDPVTKRTIELEGDSPPTEAELKQIFAQLTLKDPNRKPASAEDFTEKAPDSGGVLANMARALLPSTTPRDYIEGPAYAAAHPLDSLALLLKAVGGAQVDQFRKAGDDLRAIGNEPTIGGKVAAQSRAVGHTLAGVVPIVGPAAAHAGEQIAEGDIRGGLGSAAGLLTGVLAPGAAAKVGVKVPGLGATKNPVMAEAIALGEREGIPIDPATATGRTIMRRIQKRVGDTMGGSGVVEQFQRDQQTALSATGRRLAEKADPSGPSTPQTAGQAILDDVHGKISDLHGKANTAYDVVRGAEADPANARTITRDIPDDAPTSFSMKARPSPDDIFRGVLDDARQNGYTGSVTDLREKFLQEFKSAQSLRVETSQQMGEHGPEALLRDIRKAGGLKPFDQEGGIKYRGEYQSIQQGFNAHTTGWAQRGGAQIFRNEGKSLDGMLEALRQNPKWTNVFESTNDLMDALDEISRQGPSADVGDVQHFLGAVGVKPGTQWWKGSGGSETMALPVDLRDAKAALRPIRDQLKRQYPLTQRQASAGYQALDNIVEGPDHAPLTQVDTDLGAIKSIARGKGRNDLPELASVSQGLAKTAIDKLDATIRTTAAGAGADVLPSLLRGRQATAAKYTAGQVYDAIRSEPVQAFNQATYADDAGLRQLQKVAALAPDAMQKVGRAYLDDLVDKATANGKFERADALAASWAKLGPETKKLLFKDPAYIRDLDNFFRLAKEINTNPNPSGTAGQMTAANLASAIPMKIASKLLYSRSGIKTLINGIRLPTGRVTLPAAATTPRPAGALAPAMASTNRNSDETARR
jgi:hypothetical protein